MTEKDYTPSPTGWVREQVETIVATGTTRSVHVQDRPVVLLTMRGASTGTVRKVPVMRVEHDGVYAAVGSRGGAPKDPKWVANLRANPAVTLQDDTTVNDVVAREITGRERDEWWARCVEAFPPYAEYQTRTERTIPVFLLEAG